MRVVSCLVEDHNLLLVGLAAVVCVIGSIITMNLFKKMRSSRGLNRITWQFMAAAAGGASIWCTHFIAMLAWRPEVISTYEPVLTALSLIVAIGGCALSMFVGAFRFQTAPVLGGAIFGVAVSTMHYTGMLGLRTHAVLHFDMPYVVASMLLAAVLGMGAYTLAAYASPRYRMALSSAVMVLAIVSLHFTGMAALVVSPIGGVPDYSGVNDGFLAFGVAGVALLLLGSALASYVLHEQAQVRERRRLKALLEGSVDGMVVEGRNGIMMFNKAFAELVGAADGTLHLSSIGSWIEDAQSMSDQTVVQSQLKTEAGEVIPVEVAVRADHGDSGESLRLFSVRDLRRRLEQERRISFLARNDSLTSLPNRASFLEKLERMAHLHKHAPGFALLAIDLDRFKEVNDLYGHSVGDQLLVHIAGEMKAVIREGEFVARQGGDEFVAIVPLNNLSGQREEARAAAQRLREAIITPMQGEHTEMGCGASIGVALWPQDASETSILINNADLAMYRAKAALAEEICFYEKTMDEAVRQRRRVTQGLRDALENQEFELYYQPQVAVDTREITGYEALLRWRQKDGSFISPAEFIPVAEDTGLILPIGEWVLRRACEEAKHWDKPLRLAVNLSPVQLGHTDLPRLVHQVLIDTGFPPARLELEITETAMITDMARSTFILRQLKALGVSIAMDDFGTGYSSLSTLRAFPFDKIKLDRAFMGELEDNTQSRAIIRAVLSLGESLSIPVLAEGVETVDQLNFLREQGCDEVQGYLLGRPSRRALPLSQESVEIAKAG
ncbi:EAL domain-containing protein [Brevundimonas sp.]|uniref:bifunctional diguanylate cyclase/phosphodiesterase n=1 Tax=Brevundimonas sp. TaxID=1871086 RepID=UPI0028A0A908|nr:EAL domain-containing protein [Brevundimonas sp.]